jgi:NADH-quinone oxidoreductase subunit N
MLLSLAGVPLTAGFIGKFVVIGAGVQAAQWWLVGGVVVASSIGAYYYLRVIGAVLAVSTTGLIAQPSRWVVTGSGVMLFLAVAAILWLGVYPQPLFEFGSHLALP